MKKKVLALIMASVLGAAALAGCAATTAAPAAAPAAEEKKEEEAAPAGEAEEAEAEAEEPAAAADSTGVTISFMHDWPEYTEEFQKMADDFEAFLFERGEPVWSERNPRRAAVDAIRIERFAAEEDERHAYSRYLIEAWAVFAPFFEEPASLCDAANAALVLIDRTAALLTGQIAAATKETVEKGGFRERMTRARIERRDGIAQPTPDTPAPICPECGRPMRLRTAKSGPNAGKPFWGCSGYPACKGRRRAEESGDGTRTTG